MSGGPLLNNGTQCPTKAWMNVYAETKRNKKMISIKIFWVRKFCHENEKKKRYYRSYL